MSKQNKRASESKLQKALAMEFAKDYLKINNLSIEKLRDQQFNLSYNECCFYQPSDVVSNGLLNDLETLPTVSLIIKYEDDILKMLFKWLNRRSQKRSYTWVGFRDLLKIFPLVQPRVRVSIYG